MIEEKRFDNRLQRVHEIVMPLHMRQLVSQHGIEMCGWQPGDHADREQDYRAQPTDDRRHANDLGCKNVDRSADAKTLREDTQPEGYGLVHVARRALQPLDTNACSDKTNRE